MVNTEKENAKILASIIAPDIKIFVTKNKLDYKKWVENKQNFKTSQPRAPPQENIIRLK